MKMPSGPPKTVPEVHPGPSSPRPSPQVISRSGLGAVTIRNQAPALWLHPVFPDVGGGSELFGATRTLVHMWASRTSEPTSEDRWGGTPAPSLWWNKQKLRIRRLGRVTAPTDPHQQQLVCFGVTPHAPCITESAQRPGDPKWPQRRGDRDEGVVNMGGQLRRHTCLVRARWAKNEQALSR